MSNARSTIGPWPVPPRDRQAQRAWATLHEQTSTPYRQVGRFSWHFARGKLGRDPIFRSMLERGLLPHRGRVLDIGCGQGLLASLLQAVREPVVLAAWPATWAPAPHIDAYHGIELMQSDVDRAKMALGERGARAHFECADMRLVALPACDAVVILDVLHYVDHEAQAALLRRVRDALVPGGRLLLRVGDAARRRGFLISQWVDRAVTLCRGHRVAPSWGRTMDEWLALLSSQGFQVQSLPMSDGTPFANVLLVAVRPVEQDLSA